jgi:hypothetical protein
VVNDTKGLGDTLYEASMNIDGPLRDVIDSRFLRPTSRAFVATIMWLLARWDYTLATICFVAAGGYFFYQIFVTHHIFWDINFYSAVLKAMAAGASPYDNAYLSKTLNVTGYSFGFVYPPLVAEAFYKFRWLFLTRTGLTLLLITHVISWLSIPYLLAGSPKNWHSRNFLYVWGLYLFLFGLGGMRLLVVGNLAAILFALIIFSIVVAVRTKDYKFFWVTILVCSFVKFYLLAFLLLPVILDKRYISAAGIICALIALYTLNYFISPALFSEYVAQIAAQSSDFRNIGWSFYSLSTQIIKVALGPNGDRLSVVIALGIHLVFVVGILLIAYSIAERRARPERFDLFCCWLFMSAFLISPRVSDYDLAVVIVPFVLLARMLLIERGLGMGVAVTVAVFGFILLRTPLSFETELSKWSATFAIVGVWFGAAVHWLTLVRADGEREKLLQS